MGPYRTPRNPTQPHSFEIKNGPRERGANVAGADAGTGHTLTSNPTDGLVVDVLVAPATGGAERDTALDMLQVRAVRSGAGAGRRAHRTGDRGPTNRQLGARVRHSAGDRTERRRRRPIAHGRADHVPRRIRQHIVLLRQSRLTRMGDGATSRNSPFGPPVGPLCSHASVEPRETGGARRLAIHQSSCVLTKAQAICGPLRLAGC